MIADKVSKDLAVLVVSCDRYRDLWRPFFTLFDRFWPDCPFNVFLGANFEVYESRGVETLRAGEDKSWCENLHVFLDQISATYVLLLLEDFFLRHPVSTEAVFDCFQAMQDLDAACLRLYPLPGPDEPLGDRSDLGILHKNAPYRVSAQPAIWKRVELISLLRDGESAWDFELNGTKRSQNLKRVFLGAYEPVFDYRHVVELGQWFWSAARFYRKAEIGCDFNARPVMTPFLAAFKAVNRARKNALRLALERV